MRISSYSLTMKFLKSRKAPAATARSPVTARWSSGLRALPTQYVALTNTGAPTKAEVSLVDLGLTAQKCALRDVWAEADLGTVSTVAAQLAKTNGALLKLSACVDVVWTV